MTGPTLVVAAIRAEAAHVPHGTPVVVTGIGKVAAAVAVTRALATWPGDRMPRVVNIGTAGALAEHHDGLYRPSVVLNHDISADAIRELGAEVTDAIELPGGDGSVLATGDLFVTDPTTRDQLATRADLVDMEGFAVAAACAAFDVECVLIKHVSDTADESALSWNEQVDRSARRLAAWLGRM
ncbi:MAG: nucleosidase [Acidimicrobiales bacterium]|mgnify:CR=1 FL=1|nr:nucleosidase [Acidimicrobiales bacterium]